MHATRIYADERGCSHFESLDIPLEEGPLGSVSTLVPGAGVIFRTTAAGWSADFHPAPRRQFVITLVGEVEIECGDGSVRRFGPGDVVLADDTTGQGHISRQGDAERISIFVPVSDDVDPSTWRTAGP